MKNFVLTIGFIVCSISSDAMAQKTAIVGGESLARACFDNSQNAVLAATAANSSELGATGSRANQRDLEPCNRAISEVGLTPTDLAATYVNRGIIYAAMHDYGSAARDYNRALELDSSTGEAYLNRGNIWLLGERYTEAISDYRQALSFGVNQPQVAHLNIGMAYASQKQFQQAAESYQAALQIAPAWPPALVRLKSLPAADTND